MGLCRDCLDKYLKTHSQYTAPPAPPQHLNRHVQGSVGFRALDRLQVALEEASQAGLVRVLALGQAVEPAQHDVLGRGPVERDARVGLVVVVVVVLQLLGALRAVHVVRAGEHVVVRVPRQQRDRVAQPDHVRVGPEHRVAEADARQDGGHLGLHQLEVGPPAPLQVAGRVRVLRIPAEVDRKGGHLPLRQPGRQVGVHRSHHQRGAARAPQALDQVLQKVPACARTAR